jgi:hypothetical protein
MPWKPSVKGEIPTLGYQVIDWITDNLAKPDCSDYEPFVLYREQEEFILRWYALDKAGRRLYARGVLCRPRGWGKSPLLAALAIVEAIGPVVFDHWSDPERCPWADQHGPCQMCAELPVGQPVARPWSMSRTPLVHICAVSDKQTANTWGPLLEMLREEAPVHDYLPGIQVNQTFVLLPRGRIEKVASSSRTLKGARALFAVMDQTEEWVETNGGHDLADVIRANAAKVGGTVLESPNAFMPGDDSVAERSAHFAQQIAEGIAQEPSLLYDHREAPPLLDLDERPALLEGLRQAYGDASADKRGCVIHKPPCPPGHMNLDRLISTIYDPAQDIQRSRSDFLNQITHHSDAWITAPQWKACFRPDRGIPEDGAAIVMGFDGSQGRARGKADATALIGCEVATGHMFELGVWEQPTGRDGKGWTPPVLLVDTAVRTAFARWNVIGFYADPNGWTEHISKWEASFGRRLWLKASNDHPIMVWPSGKTAVVSKFVERTRVAIVTSGEAWTAYDKAVENNLHLPVPQPLPEVGEFSHDGSMAMTRHFLNARRRKVHTGYLIYKAYPESWDKIDAAYAGVMAWTARLDAIAKGFAQQTTKIEAVIV